MTEEKEGVVGGVSRLILGQQLIHYITIPPEVWSAAGSPGQQVAKKLVGGFETKRYQVSSQPSHCACQQSLCACSAAWRISLLHKPSSQIREAVLRAGLPLGRGAELIITNGNGSHFNIFDRHPAGIGIAAATADEKVVAHIASTIAALIVRGEGWRDCKGTFMPHPCGTRLGRESKKRGAGSQRKRRDWLGAKGLKQGRPDFSG